MRISIKHALLSILTLLVFFIVLLIYISDKQNRVREEIIEVGRQALDLSQKTHTLGMLVTDYSQSKSTDSLTRWLNTIDRVEKKYSALIQSSGLGDSVMIERVSSDITRIRTQFHLLQNVSGAKSYDWILNTLDTYNQNLIAHLDMLVRQVQEHSYDELEQLNLEQKIVVVSGVLLVCLLFAMIYVSLVTPVRIISDAVNITGNNQGKRKYKSTRIREWSVLQSKIEELLISLKQTTVSKTELEKEVQLRQLAEDDALQQAHTDFLTGLPNRRALSYMFKNKQIPSTSFGLLFIDMDNFKSINDNLGHEVGDKLLIHIGSLISQLINQNGVVARLGGDEFVALYYDDQASTESFARHLHGALNEPLVIANNKLKISCSIGVSLCPKHGTNFDELLAKADTAMFYSKSNPLDCGGVSIFSDKLQQASWYKFDITQHIKFACENDAFEVWFQPQISTVDGRVVGFESLLRLNKEYNGRLIGPDEFVPILEETSDIITVGKTVVEEAIAFRQELEELGFDVKVSVNVSALQLENDSLFNLLKEHVDKGTIDPLHFPLELTETASSKTRNLP